MAALLGRLDEALVRVEVGIAAKKGEAHRVTKLKLGISQCVVV